MHVDAVFFALAYSTRVRDLGSNIKGEPHKEGSLRRAD